MYFSIKSSSKSRSPWSTNHQRGWSSDRDYSFVDDHNLCFFNPIGNKINVFENAVQYAVSVRVTAVQIEDIQIFLFTFTALLDGLTEGQDTAKDEGEWRAIKESNRQGASKMCNFVQLTSEICHQLKMIAVKLVNHFGVEKYKKLKYMEHGTSSYKEGRTAGKFLIVKIDHFEYMWNQRWGTSKLNEDFFNHTLS